MRGVTQRQHRILRNMSQISTHTPHARRDGTPPTQLGRRRFLLTRLMRGVTRNAIIDFLQEISTHTPHARRDSGKFSG